MEEPPLVVPKRKPRKKAEFNQEIPMIGWYERDIEFEDFLKDSLAKARDKWRKEKDIVKDLLDGFNTNMEQVLRLIFCCCLYVCVLAEITNVDIIL